MKKTDILFNGSLQKPLVVIMAAVMVFAMVTGCRSNDSEDSSQDTLVPVFESTDYVYVAQSITLPSDIGHISNLAYHDGKAYFVATLYGNPGAGNQFLDPTTADIYSINLDGTELTQLSEYTPAVARPEGAGGAGLIHKLTIDNEGYIWVVERVDFYTLELPADFDINGNEEWWGYTQIIEARDIVRKLDVTGVELLSVDISSISRTEQPQEYIDIRAFTVDSTGNIFLYLSIVNNTTLSQEICVLDNAGDVQVRLNAEGHFERFIHLSGNSVAYRSGDHTLQMIDVSAKALGEVVSLPNVGTAYSTYYTGSVNNVSPGETFDILIDNGIVVYGLTLGEDGVTGLFDWFVINAVRNTIENMIITSDNQIVCLNVNRDTTSHKSELLVLTRHHRSDLPERTFLTLAGIYVSGELRNTVSEFNRTNPYYMIEIADYSIYIDEKSPNDWSAAMLRLSTEIISGNVPDMVDTRSFSYSQYTVHGLLTDLYPFIDADPKFDRSDFVQAALRAFETDGGLFEISPEFYIETTVGNPSVVGSGIGWNVDELREVLDANPGADIPFGSYRTKTEFLVESVARGIDDYIDPQTGTVRFDTPAFIQLLELADRFPDDITNWNTFTAVPSYIAVPANRQLVEGAHVSGFYLIQYWQQLFEGEIVFKGYPTENRNGNTLGSSIGVAITENSPNKEAAWAFVRMLLDKDWQLNNINLSFPTNQAAFDQRVREVLETDVAGMHFNDTLPQGVSSSLFFELRNPTQADIDLIIAFINSATGNGYSSVDSALLDIIRESASDYFSGIGSASDTARIIQSRVSIWVSERS